MDVIAIRAQSQRLFKASTGLFQFTIVDQLDSVIVVIIGGFEFKLCGANPLGADPGVNLRTMPQRRFRAFSRFLKPLQGARELAVVEKADGLLVMLSLFFGGLPLGGHARGEFGLGSFAGRDRFGVSMGNCSPGDDSLRHFPARRLGGLRRSGRDGLLFRSRGPLRRLAGRLLLGRLGCCRALFHPLLHCFRSCFCLSFGGFLARLRCGGGSRCRLPLGASLRTGRLRLSGFLFGLKCHRNNGA